MKRSNKKGFTIVELIVVIAVIAVLTAVLIPTFGGIIKKANASADEQTVYSMNKILAAEEVLSGKPANVTDALVLLSENGYKPEKMDAKSADFQMLWNEETNRIVLLNDAGAAVIDSYPLSANAWLNWEFVDTVEEAEASSYSVYLNDNDDFDGASITVKNGIDVGLNVAVNVTYYNDVAQTVALRTNGGTLTVNNSAATVNHYGYSDTVNVNAVAGESYHENGVAKVIDVKVGRFVAEKDAVINELKVAASVKVEKVGNPIVLAASGNSEATAIKTDLSAVSIPSGVAMVAYAGGIKYVSSIDEAFLINGSKVIILSKNVASAGTHTLGNGEKVEFYLNGYDYDASANLGRPFNMGEGSELVINADGSDIKCGIYGLVNFVAGKNCSVTLNGGNYTAETDNGAFLKLRPGTQTVAITLNDINYVDSSADGYILNSDSFEGILNANISGGNFKAFGGFQLNGGNGTVATVNGVVADTQAVTFLTNQTMTVSNCTIKVGNKVDGTAPAAGISAQGEGTVTATGNKITGNGTEYLYDVYSSGGTINITDDNGSTGFVGNLYNNGRGIGGDYKGAKIVITLDGETVYTAE